MPSKMVICTFTAMTANFDNKQIVMLYIAIRALKIVIMITIEFQFNIQEIISMDVVIVEMKQHLLKKIFALIIG